MVISEDLLLFFLHANYITLVKAFAWETSLSHGSRLTNVEETVKT